MITLEPPRNLAEGADPWSVAGLSRAGLSRFLKKARAAVGVAGNVDVLLASDATLRRLNREFRGKDQATDVLSFPAVEELAEQHAGDLAISFDTAGRQAREHGHALGNEVRVLMLHGLLHLHGMDHETDRGEMAAREAELRERLRLPIGLIERGGGEAKSFDAKGAKNAKARNGSVAGFGAKGFDAKGAEGAKVRHGSVAKSNADGASKARRVAA